MYNPDRRYYSGIEKVKRRVPYTEEEKKNLHKIILFQIGMIALGVLCASIIVLMI